MNASTLRDAARVYMTSLALIALAAVAMLMLSRARARELMPLAFGHVHRSVGTALSIALDNTRVALVPLSLSLVAHQGRAIRALGDSLAGAMLLFNAAELGSAVAGYGARTLVALAPHAPLELAAYSAAGAAYLAGRHQPLEPARLAALAAACAVLLLVAAVLETYVQLRAPA
jgi:uncharacterized membrane protein SpoIIM required for sporulation